MIERTPSSLKVVVATGGFDPIHSGHIAYLEAAAKLGDILIVGINSDAWLTRKKGYPFMPVGERVAIVKALKCVDHTVLFDDSDGSAIEAIHMLDFYIQTARSSLVMVATELYTTYLSKLHLRMTLQ